MSQNVIYIFPTSVAESFDLRFWLFGRLDIRENANLADQEVSYGKHQVDRPKWRGREASA